MSMQVLVLSKEELERLGAAYPPPQSWYDQEDDVAEETTGEA